MKTPGLRSHRRRGLRHLLSAGLVAGLPAFALAADALRVLAWPGYADPDIVKTFEQRYKVTVEVTIVSTDENLWQRISAHDGADFDVFAVNTAELRRYLDAGLVAPLDLARLPNITLQQPRFRDHRAIPNVADGRTLYAVPYTYAEMGLIYDRQQVKEPPTSISALWDPRFKGRVLAYDTGGHNYSIAALSLGLPDPFRLDEASMRQATAHLVALRRNVLTFYSLPEESVQLFREHKAMLLFANYGSQQVQQLKKAGADIGYVIPKEGALAWLDCWTMTRGARDKALAQSWINYMLEKPVGRALSERQGLGNTVDASAAVDPSHKLIWLQPVENASRRSALWARIVSGDRMLEMPRP